MLRLVVVMAFVMVVMGQHVWANTYLSREAWHEVKQPTGTQPEVYGTYTSGCIEGALPLLHSAKGYQLARSERGRYYGHPQLIDFIEEYAGDVFNNFQQILLIGDVSQPRGGPSGPVSAHNSHQTGLDVDIWYKSIQNNASFNKGIQPYSLVDKPNDAVDENIWENKHAKLLKLAASYDEVDRIFVNPAIKHKLCEKYRGDAWMAKIRPWWGHDKHFHVRLKCPENSRFCEQQSAVPSQDGCDSSLMWWFSEEAKELARQPSKKKEPILPVQCKQVFGWGKKRLSQIDNND